MLKIALSISSVCSFDVEIDVAFITISKVLKSIPFKLKPEGIRIELFICNPLVSWISDTNLNDFSGVLFATITCLGSSFNSEGSIPLLAPPAPITKMVLFVISISLFLKLLTRPIPSVQSAKILFPLRCNIFAAPA